ncbi:MAG: FAD-dependent oxidoreductase [Steroidobacteraceae bacterium]
MKPVADGRTVDLLVVGSGGGGLVAALTAAASGQEVLVIEKLSTVGGSTALSGGALWIPNSSLLREGGLTDSDDAAWTYVDNLVGDVGRATRAERKRAYLTQGPRMIDFLREQGVALKHVANYPDYYASRPGGCTGGRSIEAVVFDGKALGTDYARVSKRNFSAPAMVIRAQDLSGIANGFRTWNSFRANVGMLRRTVVGLLLGRKMLSMGMALVGQLLLATQRRNIRIVSDTPLLRLRTGVDGQITGATVRHNGKEMTVHSRHGVVLACGGFARNAQMRATYQPQLGGDWTHASAGDEGDGIRAGMEVGAAVEQMDEAWWMPTFVMADGSRHMCGFERSKPHSIIVDVAGERLCNESGSYMEIGQRMFARQAKLGHRKPFWLILDALHRRHYPFTSWPPGLTPRIAFDSGFMLRAATLEELAQRCGIDAAGLKLTVQRYNRMSKVGSDEDFHRGDDPCDRFYGDPSVKPNPTMGAIEHAPFYAVALYPGDIGTNGGLLTDEHARVLREDGTVIEGLYATGNCTASVMGRAYPGAGATIGPSMVFGYVAAQQALRGIESSAGRA